MNILINASGIVDSGGVTIFEKLLNEFSVSPSSQYYVVCNRGSNLDCLMNRYVAFSNIHFIAVPSRGLLYRLYYENIIFRHIISSKDIQLIYNFSGSCQFFMKIPQIVKVQNLLFFSKILDSVYIKKRNFFLWIKQIFIKRIIIKFMLNKSHYLEIQSEHVKNNLSDFIITRDKLFYVKSDIDISEVQFQSPKRYDFTKKIKFLYIVGPHFEYVHKNFSDFTKAMLILQKSGVDFEINITLSEDQLNRSKIWDRSLNPVTNFFGYISDKSKLKELFCDNTILISTSIVETLGLHVIEGIRNGVITVAPNERYSTEVYGKNIYKYELFNIDSLIKTIMNIINYQDSHVSRILYSQEDIKNSEMCKYESVIEIFSAVENVYR